MEIETNLGIPISVKRSAGTNKDGKYSVFGSWNLDIPSLYGPIMGNYMTGANVCSTAWTTSRYIPGSGNADMMDNGPHLGGVSASRVLLLHDGSISAPANTLYVSSDNWAVTCANNIYKAISPEGLTYTFGQLVQFKVNSNKPSTVLTSDGHRGHVMLMVTNITDRFGKTINFTYQEGLIRKINSSDGSEVSFTYNANYDVSSITANGRVWYYTYSGVALTGVTLPEGNSWSFNLSEMLATPSSYQPTVSGTITHPYGAVGSFTAQRTKHGRSLVPTFKHDSGKYLLDKDEYHNSLVSKNISGPGLPAMAWSYVYSANDGAYAGTATSDIKTVQIYDPEGNSEKYHFYRSFDWREGKVYKKEVFQASTLKASEVSTWSKGNKIGQVFGDNFLSAGKDDYRSNLSQQVISRGTDSFTTDFTSYDVWGNPGAYTKYSNLSATKKYYTQTYFNDLAKWLIGFPLETKLSSDNLNYQSLNRTAYYAANHSFASLPQYEYKSGRLFRTYTSYFSSGTSSGMPSLISFNDGRGYVQIGAYKNSVPTLVTRPTSDGLSTEQASLTVDANGWVTAYSDYNGNYTTFDYSTLGWRTLVDPGDPKWNSTSISYAAVSGYLTRTISKGNYRKLEKFDAFLRTIQSEEYDITNSSGKIVRYFEYDSNGKSTFEGFPLLGSYSYGLRKTYDALGRVTSVLDNSNNAKTSYTYLNGHTVSITDPKGYSTNIAYQSFGAPDYDSVIRITSPENVQTNLSYNIRDNLIAVTQGGITEHRVYNTYQDLCKIIRPDVGNTGFFYNSSGQMQWKASGSSIDSVTTTCDTLADVSQKQTYSFDSRGNLKTVVFSDSNLNRTFGYDANDNLISASSGAVSKTTSYDSLNQVINQKLAVDGREFNLVYGYDANAHVSSLTYPDGEVVNYTPNALGQPTQVGAYATGTTYHQTGELKGFSYGNSFVRSTTVQNNGLLSRVTDKRSTISALDQGLAYDLNANISQLTDYVSSIHSLTLTYDGLDRLKTFTSSSIGAGNVSYDTLSNITSLKHGSEILNYTYSSNRLSSVTGSKSFSYAYDSQGNVTNNGLYSLTFNAAGQLEYAKGNSFQYDASNIRVRSIEAQGISYFVHGVDGKLVYRDKQGVAEKYYYLNGSQVAKKSGATVSYAHANYLGSPEAHSNTSGVVTSRTYYRPFGATIGLAADDVGYTGHKYDAELGLTYMQQRYYDPVIGRFYSNDPVDTVSHLSSLKGTQGFNRYSYAVNNPYKYADPDGRKIEWSGSDSDVKAAQTQLATVSANSTTGAAAVTQLSASSNTHTINVTNTGSNSTRPNSMADGTNGKGTGSTINFNLSKTTGPADDSGNTTRSPAIGLGHEIGHAADLDSGSHPQISPLLRDANGVAIKPQTPNHETGRSMKIDNEMRANDKTVDQRTHYVQ